MSQRPGRAPRPAARTRSPRPPRRGSRSAGNDRRRPLLSSTIGWFTGSSTRTPTTRSSSPGASPARQDLPLSTLHGAAPDRPGWGGGRQPGFLAPVGRTRTGRPHRRARPADPPSPASRAAVRRSPPAPARPPRPGPAPPGCAAAISGVTTCSNRPISRSAADRYGPQVPGLDPVPRPSRRRRWRPQRVPVVAAAGPLARAGRTAPAGPALGGVPGRWPPARPGSAGSPTAPARTRSASGSPAPRDRPRPAPGGAARAGLRRLQAAVDRVQVVLDHPQRQVVVALLGQHEPQPGHVGRRELAVARGRPLRIDEALGLEEPDLGDRDVRELRPQLTQDLPDAQGGPGVRPPPRSPDHLVTAGSSPPARAPADTAAGTCRPAPRRRRPGRPRRCAGGSRTCRSGCRRRTTEAPTVPGGTPRAGGRRSRRRGRCRCPGAGRRGDVPSSRNRLPGVRPALDHEQGMPGGSASTARPRPRSPASSAGDLVEGAPA